VFPGRREQLRVCGHSRVWVGAEEERSRCGGCWVEQSGMLEEDDAASRGGAVAAGRRRNQRAKGNGRSLFLEEKTMERKKKGRLRCCWSSFTAGVRRMTDWEGWLCLGEKEQENGAGLREEEDAGTGWRGKTKNVGGRLLLKKRWV